MGSIYSMMIPFPLGAKPGLMKPGTPNAIAMKLTANVTAPETLGSKGRLYTTLP